MRMLIHTKIPHEPMNALIRAGKAGDLLRRILDETKPEAAYFTEYGGQRGAILIVNVNDASEVPRFAEPWFLNFNADVSFHIVMTPEDLGRAELEDLGRKWG